jgi:hypothetical protein
MHDPKLKSVTKHCRLFTILYHVDCSPYTIQIISDTAAGKGKGGTFSHESSVRTVVDLMFGGWEVGMLRTEGSVLCFFIRE